MALGVNKDNLGKYVLEHANSPEVQAEVQRIQYNGIKTEEDRIIMLAFNDGIVEETKPTLTTRIAQALGKASNKIKGVYGKLDAKHKDRIHKRQIRFLKGYKFKNFEDEKYIKNRYHNQEKQINFLNKKIEQMIKLGATKEDIDEAVKVRDSLSRRLYGMKTIMKDQMGFDFISEEEKEKSKDAWNEYNKKTDTIGSAYGLVKNEYKDLNSLQKDVKNPNYLKMIAAHGEGLGQFRTSYSKIVRSERKLRNSELVSALLFSSAFLATYLAMRNIGITSYSEFNAETFTTISKAVEDGINNLKQMNSSNIGEILSNASTSLVLSASAFATSTLLTIKKARDYKKVQEERMLMEDQNYLNIGDDVDNIARRM